MLPIVDYGSIAIVVPNVTAVGRVIDEENKSGFEVYLVGLAEPIIVLFESKEDAENSRDELIAIIAQYHYMKEFGPDFDIDNLEEFLEEDDDDDSDDRH